MIFNFYLFDRKGTCLYFAEWKRVARLGRRDDDSVIHWGSRKEKKNRRER